MIEYFENKSLSEALDLIFDGGYIDSHSHSEEIEQTDAVLIHRRWSDIEICWAGDCRYFSVNPFRLIDGKVWLSTASSGGVVDVVNSSGDIRRAIEKYNRAHDYTSEFYSQLELITREEWMRKTGRRGWRAA